MNSYERVLVILPRVAPSEIDSLWAPEVARAIERSNFQHALSENLTAWASNAAIDELLQSRTRCLALVQELATAAVRLGLAGQQLTSQTGNTIYVAKCMGCNTCWDSGGCEHGDSSPKRNLCIHGLPWEADVILNLHQTVKLLGILCNLLANPESNMLTQLIIREAPPGVSPPAFFLQNSSDVMGHPLGLLVGLLDNCASPFPKAAHLGAAALSLLVSRRPSVALSSLDPGPLTSSIFQYMWESIFHLINNSECRVEEYFGVVSFINLLPLLYFFGDWKEAHTVLPQHQLPSCITSIAINILHSAASDDAWDSPPDVDKFPELGNAKVWVRPLFESNEMAATVLRERPMSFVVAASIEVLGRWASKRVPVGVDTIPVSRGPPATVASSLQEYQPQLEVLMERTPAIAPLIRPIVNDIVEGNRPRLPVPGTSLLHESLLRASMRCAWSSCNRTSCDDGESLLRCAGGCGGLARYCSKEHQTKHWAQHKHFCKRQPARNRGGAA